MRGGGHGGPQAFLAGDGSWVTSSTILAALDRVGAAACRILYLHTGMTFGLPNPELPRRELLNHLWELIADLGVPSVLLPTFTFSYCNGEDYDVQRSRSRMGALNEHLRALPEAVRSLDPLMSNILLGEDLDLVTSLGRQSVGEGSTFTGCTCGEARCASCSSAPPPASALPTPTTWRSGRTSPTATAARSGVE